MREYSIYEVDRMEGHEFETFCAELLKENGYENTEVTPGSGDQGIDVIAYKDGIKFGIQCKCYSSDIGNKAVQEAYSGKEFYGCHIGAVLSNRHFTPSAIELASKNRILLWDREYLINLLQNANLYKEQDNYNQNTENSSIDIEKSVIDMGTTSAIDINQSPEKKYTVKLVAVDKKIFRKSESITFVAREISYATGIPAKETAQLLYRCPSEIAVKVSKEKAESIVQRLRNAPFGRLKECSFEIEEDNRTDAEIWEEEREKNRKIANNLKRAIPGLLILTLLFGFLTVTCWNNSSSGDLDVLIVIFAFLTLFSTILVFNNILEYIKASEKF